MKTCGDIDGKPCEMYDARCPRATHNNAVTIQGPGGTICEVSPAMSFLPDVSYPACAPMLALVEARTRVAELETALKSIRNYTPESVPTLPDGWNAGCEKCKIAAERKWPPSHLCDEHYRQIDTRRQEIEHREKSQHYEMREIAARALRVAAQQAQKEEAP